GRPLELSSDFLCEPGFRCMTSDPAPVVNIVNWLSARALRPASTSLFGLITCVFVYVYKGKVQQVWAPSLDSLAYAFVAGGAFPLGVLLLVYPLLPSPPPLEDASWTLTLG